MSETARIPYTDVALPLAGSTVTLFNTVTMFPGGDWLAGFRMKRLQIDLLNSHAGTLNYFKSRGHRGATSALTTWVQVLSTAVAAATANTSQNFDALVEEFEEFKVEWVESGTNATQFDVDVALSDERVKGT